MGTPIEFVIHAKDAAAEALAAIGKQAGTRSHRGAADISLALLVVAVIGIVLLLFRVHFGG